VFDQLALVTTRSLLWLLNCLPLALREEFLTALVHLVFLCLPRHRRIAIRNLERAFPEHNREWHQHILRSSYRCFARVLVDFARLHTLDDRWVREHVSCPFIQRYRELQSQHPSHGLIIVTGHLGSFELLAHAVPVLSKPIAFVARAFELPRFDAWWTSIREANGNVVIDRKGAFREIPKFLAQGTDVALLCDQNVKRNHAVFVPFFGNIAATTKTPAIVALRNTAPIVVAAVLRRGVDQYEIDAVECDFSALYRDEAISNEQKIYLITARVTAEYEAMIRKQPEAWFWMHRRWRTVPEGANESFYEGC